MGSWGITMRQSNYGLILLGTIVDTELKEADFTTYNVTDTLEVITAKTFCTISRHSAQL